MPTTKQFPWFSNLNIFCLMALAGIAGPISFALLVLIVQSLQPEHDPIKTTISPLVWGRFGWLQTIAFVLFGILIIVFALRFYSSYGSRFNMRIGSVCLGLVGLGFIILAAFPAPPPGAPKIPGTSTHTLISDGMSLLFVIALVFITAGLRRVVQYRGTFIYTLITSVLASFLAIGNTLLPRSSPYMGLAERLLLLNGMVWIEVMSIRLLQDCLCEKREAAASSTSTPRPT